MIYYVKFIIIYVAENKVVLAERKLTTYVYAVGKQPTGEFWYKMMELAGQLWKKG